MFFVPSMFTRSTTSVGVKPISIIPARCITMEPSSINLKIKSLSVTSPTTVLRFKPFMASKFSFGRTKAVRSTPFSQSFLATTLPICPVAPVIKYFSMFPPDFLLIYHNIVNFTLKIM